MFFPALNRRPPAAALLPLSARLLSVAVLAVGGLAGLLAPSPAVAQTPGTLDTAFTSAEVGATFYALTFEEVNGVRYLFLGGDGGLDQRELASTGEVDGAFVLGPFGLPTQRILYTAVPELVTADGQPAPKVLVGGLFGRDFTQVRANEPGQNIKRFLPADGTLDPAFNPGTGANSFVTSILPLADGSMVVGGEFDQFNKVTHQRIVKLDNGGAIVDNSVFSSSLAFDATVLSLAPQYAADGSGQNGQILVGGLFGSVSGQGHAKLARINADGSVDGSFNPAFSDRVRVVISQPDGKILVGGDFEVVNGAAVKHLVRLNYDGSLDPTFNCLVTAMPALIAAPVAVNTITPLGDGRYYIGGNFAKINGVTRNFLGRVLADGTLDDFDTGGVVSNTVQQVLIDQTTNKIYVAQNREKTINNVFPASVFRFFGDPVPPPSVTIGATVPVSSRAQSGSFTITRATDDNSSALDVYFTRGGTAKNKGPKQPGPDGKPVPSVGDYKLVPTPIKNVDLAGQTDFFVTIPANSNSVTITVKATNTARSGSAVTLTLQADQSGGTEYTVGTASAASVILGSLLED